MITLTHEEAQQVLGALEQENSIYAETDNDEGSDVLIAVIELLRSKMHEYPKNQVRPHEFLKAVEGKEEFVGMPIIWAEWPTKESSNE
jgi:hypothetical protein